MTEKQAWGIIEEMEWAKRQNEDSEALAKEFYGHFGKKTMRQLHNFCTAKAALLYGIMEKYEEDNNTCLATGGDDSTNDILWHVIGLGQHIFNHTCANPEQLQMMYHTEEYTESFAYVFLEPDVITPEMRKEAFEEFMDCVDHLQKTWETLKKQMDRTETEMQELYGLRNKIRNWKINENIS